MNSPTAKVAPDQTERNRALSPERSILVEAPAGSGKTDLLTRRFLRLLGEVDDPGQIVAITFTIAAAAEMRHRILSELEKAAGSEASESAVDEFSMDALAHRALERSRILKWNLLDLPAQLRISTIDSFCRDLALQQPLLSGVGGNLQIAEYPEQLYRRAAWQTLQMIAGTDPQLVASIESLLLWRDNGWHEMEDLLVEMLGKRDRWMHEFVLARDPDWETLREQLERPFKRAVNEAISKLGALLEQVPGACDQAHQLARFACTATGGVLHQDLAELVEFPCGPFNNTNELEEAHRAHVCLAELLLTDEGAFRRQVNKNNGFPPDQKQEKQRLLNLIQQLGAVPGLGFALHNIRSLPPARYTDEDWQIVRACFSLLRHAAGQLKIVFAEAGTVDFIEVAQIALQVLRGEDGIPSEAALSVAEGIRHLLVDEFQDTSRRQHQLLSSLIAAWPDQLGRTLFVVGDPMQSIYFFRDADAELFPRVKGLGLEIRDGLPFLLDSFRLKANFRTEPTLVQNLNDAFDRVFAIDDRSGISFSPTEPAREPDISNNPRLQLHLEFIPQSSRGKSSPSDSISVKRETTEQREAAHKDQTAEIVDLIRSHAEHIEQARKSRKKYRIAVLSRTRTALAPIAQALHEANIPFRAVDLEALKDRPEILDALALARALMNPQDRVAWLGVFRAPWCGLSLEELHSLAADTATSLPPRPIPHLLADRLHLLSNPSRKAAERVLNAIASVPRLRATLPTASLGTLLQHVWLNLGGESCVDTTAFANLRLLWSCLDRLPNGEQDLLGTGLTIALESLRAIPDPAASAECGVQLMTIHKSKGLEFEVVIVPELQAGTGKSEKKLLSWLERGLKDPEYPNEITEFLIAPLPSKGTDRGRAKAWVDRVYRERELQETRRILYVAATRAREELHIFARPSFKMEDDGTKSLIQPSQSLLATAWPAFEDEVRARFDQWISAQKASADDEEQVIEAIAAASQNNLLFMPSASNPTLLRRLPADFQTTSGVSHLSSVQEQVPIGAGSADPYERHEGGLLSRALGNAVHKLLEELACLRATLDWDPALTSLARLRPRITSQIRAAGVAPAQAASVAAKAFDHVIQASKDPHGQWILSPHADAASEASWAGVLAGDLRLVRVDRVFRAGSEPMLGGDEAWWIIDFKTAHADNLDPAVVLPRFRATFAPQLEMYAAMLRNLHGPEVRLRAGLYYPRMSVLDWWEI